MFPRWIGYFNAWAAVSFIPAGLIIFFKNGILAWNGLVAWWIGIAMFGAWIVLMIWLMFRATKQQELEESHQVGANAAV